MHDVTKAVLMVVVVALTLYDLFALLRWGEPATISVTFYRLCKEHPIFAFALGVVVGHLLWPNGDK